MTITARSAPNIALIKYWGNRNDALRLPAADSLSMTLDAPLVDIDIDHADTLTVRSFEANGSERTLTEKQMGRLEKHLSLTKQYFDLLGIPEAIDRSVSLTIRSAIPQSIGLASSAAVFSCLARAYAGMAEPVRRLSLEEMSIIARLGSGSAARSVYGGFAALHAGDGDGIDAAAAVQIADEQHWMLHDIIIVPSHDEKKVGSTEGHELAPTSPHFAARVEAIRSRRQRQCIDAIVRKDFELLQQVAEEDALDMHRVMETSDPPIRYLTEETHRIIRDTTELRDSAHLAVLYTMDAGPTVHLICTDEAVHPVKAFADAQKGCTIFEAKIGPGARLL